MNINFKNFSTYLSENPSYNGCGHTTINFDAKAFKKIGNLYDDSFGQLSYLEIQSEKAEEHFLGAYPLQDCTILECKTCQQILLLHFEQGGIAPRPEYFLIDYNHSYCIDPAVKAVRMPSELCKDFIDAFQLKTQFNTKNSGFKSPIQIADKMAHYLFNYRENKTSNGDYVTFDIVGPRSFLMRANEWLKKHTPIS